MNYYNENDKKVSHWLQCLIRARLIPAGHVDGRDIRDVQPKDLKGYTQCHFFAGIGGWSYALQLAGWPEDRPVWTGSCPCQPFSNAGKRKGVHDDRHLWPEFRRLIEECSPPEILGEQVGSKAGRLWLNGVRTDLEALGYGVGAADLCAAGVGAPHIRQRLWWVGSSIGSACERNPRGVSGEEEEVGQKWVAVDGDMSFGSKHASTGMDPGRLADAENKDGGVRVGTEEEGIGPEEQRRRLSGISGEDCRLGEPNLQGSQGQCVLRQSEGEQPLGTSSLGFWSNYELIPCGDEKQRRIEPGSFPLAHGIRARVAQLRGLGNAIVPQVAAEFIKAYMVLG